MYLTLKLRLTCLLVSVACVLYAAAPPTADPYTFADFETNVSPNNAFRAPQGGGTVTSRTTNPHKTGINTSSYVMTVVTPNGANFGGTIFSEAHGSGSAMTALFGVDFVPGYDYVDIMMYRENNNHIPQLKIVDRDDYGTDLSTLDLHPIAVDNDPNGNIQVGVWQKITYNITRCHNTGINFIYIMPDREGQSTIHIDNIVFSKDHTPPVMVSATCGTASQESITLTVRATDNLTDPVRKFMVSQDGTYAHAVEYIANSTGTYLTIPGLLPSTTYNFRIWAKDDAGNVSENYIDQSCRTADPPQVNWCDRSIQASGKTIKVSCTRTFTGASPVAYTLTIKSDEAMTGLHDGDYCYVNGGAPNTYQYGGAGNYTVSGDGRKITCVIMSTTDPVFYTNLGVKFVNGGYVAFSAPADIVWGQCEEDTKAPTMGAVSCGTSTASSIKLNVTATDDKSNPVTTFRVSIDGGVASNYIASAGVVTIAGLSAGKNYSFEVWAVDDAGNVSANSTSHSCETAAAGGGSTANYCDRALSAGGKTIYLSMEEVSAGNYRITITGDNVISHLAGTHILRPGQAAYALRNAGVKTDGGKTVTIDFASTNVPSFDTPLYIVFESGGEVNFGKPTDIKWGSCMPDSEPPVMISASVYDRDQSTVTLNVSATDDATNPVTDFCVSIGSASAGTCNDYVADANGRITITGLTGNTEYCFYVWAKDGAGNQSANYKMACARTLTFSDSGEGTCDKAYTTSGNSIYGYYTTLDVHLSFLKVSENQYKIVAALNGWSNNQISNPYKFELTPGSHVYINGRNSTLPLSTVSNADATLDTITITINSTTPPEFYTPFYIKFGATASDGNNTVTTEAQFEIPADVMNAATYGVCKWIIYHTGDTEKAGDRTQYAGGKIGSQIQYRRRFTEGVWETLYLPFEVASVQLTDGVDFVDLTAYTGSNGTTAHYFLRTFGGEVLRENFKANWSNQSNLVPQKGIPYIMQFPNAGGVFANNYIVFNGAGGQTIESAYNGGDVTPSTNYFDYVGNNTMMPQSQAGYILSADGLWFNATEGAVPLNPFECYVAANEATRNMMPRFNMNTRFKPSTPTDIHEVPTIAEKQFFCSTDGEMLNVEALSDVTIRIYSAGGWLVREVKLRSNERTALSLPRGVYMLQSEGQIEKVLL